MTARLWLGAAIASALLAVGAFAEWRLTAPALQRAHAEAMAGKAQARIATTTTRIIDQTASRERTILRRTEAHADEIETAVGAETPVPAPILSAWRDGLHDAAGADPDRDPR